MKKLIFVSVVILMLLLCGCGHTHEYSEEVVEPTCTKDGYTEHVCECGDKYQDAVISAGHKEEVLPAKDATCTEDGLTQGTKCSVCGEILVAQEPVAAAGHQYGAWVVVKEATYTEAGSQEKECSVCGNKVTQEIPMKEVLDIIYDLNGEDGIGYDSIEQLGDDFLADFNKYGETTATKENFQTDSKDSIKIALANAEMLEKWNWLWGYMLAHLKETNPNATSAYITDTYSVLERMMAGDTTAILDNGNARTSIRSYIHGLLNSMKGCGDLNADFSKFSPDFSLAEARDNFMKGCIAVTLDKGTVLMTPVKNGYTFVGWMNADGKIVTEAIADDTLTAVWKLGVVEPDPEPAITEPTIIVSNVTASAGETVQVEISIKNNPGIAGARIFLTYNAKLTLTKAEEGSAFAVDVLDYMDPPNLKSGCSFNWDSLTGEAKEDGAVLVLTFDVAADVSVGDTLEIVCSYIEGDIYDEDLNNVSLDCIKGAIIIK